MRRTTRRTIGRVAGLLRWAVLIVAAAILNVPLLITGLTAIKTDADINASPPVWIFRPTLGHFTEIFADPTLDFPRYLINSTSIALGGTALAILLTLPAAYAITKLERGARTLLPIVTNLRALPLIVFVIPFYLAYQALGLLDTRAGLAIVSCIINLPLALILFVGFLQDLPLELEEAARVDGASTLAILTRIVTPLARPIITTVAILGFISSWNEFLFGLILSTSRATPVTVGATYFITSWGIRWGATAAAMVISVLPPLVLGFVSYRFLGRATMAGAVKG
jgi:multiple sugar transport system permease protein